MKGEKKLKKSETAIKVLMGEFSDFWKSIFNACGANLLQLTVNVINSGKNCSILIERVN